MKTLRKVICWGSKCHQNIDYTSKTTENRFLEKLFQADPDLDLKRAPSDLNNPGKVQENQVHKEN